MASRPTVDHSKHLNIESERLAISLAITIEEGDADKFGDIYDSSIPSEFGQNKVENIKERVRELLEHPEELETLKADFQVADDLMSKLSQTFLGNDFRSLSRSLHRINSKDTASCCPSDVNHNFGPVSGSVSMEGREEFISNNDDSRNKKDTLSADSRIGNLSDASKDGEAPSLKRHGSIKSNSYARDNIPPVVSVKNINQVKNEQKPEEVDDKIHFGVKLQPTQENFASPAKIKRNILPSKRDVKSADQTDGIDTVGPHSPHKLLENAVNLIGKPSEADVKNCPDPAPVPPNHREDVHLTESTPILGHSRSERGAKIPQKRQGEQQREREVEDVYPDGNPVLSTTVPANFCYNNYGTMQGLSLPLDDSMIDAKIEDPNAMDREAVRKKKRKKKKKSKPGDNGAESTAEGDEVKSSREVGKPLSMASDKKGTRKISAESSSEKENLSGESDSKVQQVTDKSIDMKEKMNDRNSRTKESGSKKKKAELRKKKENEEKNELANKAVNSRESDDRDEETKQEDTDELPKVNEHDQVGSKKDSSVFALRRAADDESGFHSNNEHTKETDCRAAMSDPGENDDGDGEFNVVTSRRSRRRPREAGQFGHQGYASRNILFYDSASSRYDRNQDTPWYIRKSSSLPKEMCNFSSARRRTVMSEAEEPVSTTTTTTTASSRRDSLESDENIDQKRFSYASKLKVNIQGNSSVQSGPEANRDVADSMEVLDRLPLQSNTKPKIYSIGNDKKDADLDLLVHPTPELKQGKGNPPSSSSITSAMNLEVGLVNSSHKFDLNFPNLTGNTHSSSKDGANPSGKEGENRSVQYLDLECTSNTYAGRVKQSLGNSNKMALNPASEVGRSDNLRTTKSGPETAKVHTGEMVTIEDKLVPLLANQKKEVCGLNHVKPLAGKAEIGNSSDVVLKDNVECGISTEYTVSKSNVHTESGAGFIGTDLKGSVVRSDCEKSNELQSSKDTNAGNPIWFGSLLVLDDEIKVINDSDPPQDNLPHERGLFPENPSLLAQEMSSPMGSSSNKGETDKVEERISVELMSGVWVKIVTGDLGANTGKFNHSRIREMLLKDWEKTIQQGQEFPDTVHHAMD